MSQSEWRGKNLFNIHYGAMQSTGQSRHSTLLFNAQNCSLCSALFYPIWLTVVYPPLILTGCFEIFPLCRRSLGNCIFVLIRNVLDFPNWIVIPNVETGGKQENYWSAQCSRLLLEVCSVMYPHKNAIPQRSPTKRTDLETSGENEGLDKLQSVRSGKTKQSQVKASLRHRAE